jgi:hypothetical protein
MCPLNQCTLHVTRALKNDTLTSSPAHISPAEPNPSPKILHPSPLTRFIYDLFAPLSGLPNPLPLPPPVPVYAPLFSPLLLSAPEFPSPFGLLTSGFAGLTSRGFSPSGSSGLLELFPERSFSASGDVVLGSKAASSDTAPSSVPDRVYSVGDRSMLSLSWAPLRGRRRGRVLVRVRCWERGFGVRRLGRGRVERSIRWRGRMDVRGILVVVVELFACLLICLWW